MTIPLLVDATRVNSLIFLKFKKFGWQPLSRLQKVESGKLQLAGTGERV
jgi:hypothetical protein